MEQSKKKRFTGLIAVLLLLIATVLCWRAYKLLVVTDAAKISPALSEQNDPNLTHNYIPYAGTVAISHDRSFTDVNSFEGPTQLDTMDLQQIAAFRKNKVQEYAQLNFFHPGYDPFKPPHNKRNFGELWGRGNFGDVDSQRAFLLMGET